MFSVAGAIAFLANAKRWLTKETAAALGSMVVISVAVVAVVAGLTMLYGAGGAASEARVNWRWLYQLNTVSRKHAEDEAARNKRIADAASTELAKVSMDLRAATDARIALEREIAALKDGKRIIYSLDERRRLFKR